MSFDKKPIVEMNLSELNKDTCLPMLKVCELSCLDDGFYGIGALEGVPSVSLIHTKNIINSEDSLSCFSGSSLSEMLESANLQLTKMKKDLKFLNDSYVKCPKDYGAKGDGEANDTEYFIEIENESSQYEVDLCGGVYSLDSIWSDPKNGVQLKKCYYNGKILLDGKEVVMNKDYSYAKSSSLANTYVPEYTTSKPMGFIKRSDNEIEIFNHTFGPYWIRKLLYRESPDSPFNIVEQTFEQFFEIIAARDDGVTYAGSWAVDNNSTGLSTPGKAYISGRAQQSLLSGDYVDVDFNGGGDVFVVFSSQDDGAQVNVTIDGSSEYVILPEDVNGDKFFDTYAPLPVLHGQIVQVASGLPEGNHTIRLRNSSISNPLNSSGESRYIHVAISFSGSLSGPYSPLSSAKEWKEGEFVLKNMERVYSGNSYYAETDGFSGTVPPTHVDGLVSDGSINWGYKRISSYQTLSHRVQALGSQLEYAYEITPNCATKKEDVGGLLHGNETVREVTYLSSGSEFSPQDNVWVVAQEFSIIEKIDVNHSEAISPVIDTIKTYNFKAGPTEIKHKHKLLKEITFGYYYPHMWPLLHYSSIGQKYGVDKVLIPSYGTEMPSDYYGNKEAFLGRTKDLALFAEGEAMQEDGSGGIPTSESSNLRFYAGLEISPESVNDYNEKNTVYAAIDMNTNGADVSEGGYASMTSKLYFMKFSGSHPVTLPAGTCMNHEAVYHLNLGPNNTI